MAATDPAERLSSGLNELGGQAFEAGTVRKLMAYLGELARWNRSYNLTSVSDPSEMVVRHLLDSLAVLPWIGPGPLLDAGTGAGLPGVPLAVARPELQLTLLDSAGKKVRFLSHVKRELGLDNVHPVHARLESFRPEQPPRQVISRAFSSLERFAEACRQLAPVELLAMKGRYPATELEQLPPDVRVAGVEKLEVPGLQEERHLVIMSLNP